MGMDAPSSCSSFFSTARYSLVPVAECAAALRLLTPIDHIRPNPPALAADHGRLPSQIACAWTSRDGFRSSLLRVSQRPLRLRVRSLPRTLLSAAPRYADGATLLPNILGRSTTRTVPCSTNDIMLLQTVFKINVSIGSVSIGTADDPEGVDEGRGLFWSRPNEREADSDAVCHAFELIERVGVDSVPKRNLGARPDSLEPIV